MDNLSPYSYLSRDGSHWRDFGGGALPQRGLGRAARVAVAVLLLPVALLTLAVTRLLIPVVVAASRRRGR